jgi:hypothetical protein
VQTVVKNRDGWRLRRRVVSVGHDCEWYPVVFETVSPT